MKHRATTTRRVLLLAMVGVVAPKVAKPDGKPRLWPGYKDGRVCSAEGDPQCGTRGKVAPKG